MIHKTKFWRRKILQRTHHNIAIIPDEMVERDYQTDSLLHKPSVIGSHRTSSHFIPRAVSVELEKKFKSFYGFPYVIPVSQGRVAEAMLCRLLVRNGHYIPSSELFPTTKAHMQINGGNPVSITMLGHAWDDAYPFKGNLDPELLEKTIQTFHVRWIPFICVEPCTNATGGHPVSMANMKEIHKIAAAHGIPIYLDASRLIENCFMIRERELKYHKSSIEEIMHEFCSYADGCTMSATKDFRTPIGGFFAMRDETLYHKAWDFVMAFGSGLSFHDKEMLQAVLSEPKKVFLLVEQKMSYAKILYEAIRRVYPVVKPVGGHAVYINADALNLHISSEFHPEKSFLHHLYKQYGIRAAENPQCASQSGKALSLIRFAVPLIGETERTVSWTAQKLIRVYAEKERIEGLEKTGQPPGLTGEFRAQFRPVNHRAVKADMAEAA